MSTTTLKTRKPKARVCSGSGLRASVSRLDLALGQTTCPCCDGRVDFKATFSGMVRMLKHKVGAP